MLSWLLKKAYQMRHARTKKAHMSSFEGRNANFASLLYLFAIVPRQHASTMDLGLGAGAAVNVGKAYDIVFAQIITRLHFDQMQFNLAGVAHAMLGPLGDID